MVELQEDLGHNAEAIAGLREYLRLVDTGLLRRKIRHYEVRSKRRSSRKEIRQDLYEVLMPSKGRSFTLQAHTGHYDAGKKFYRCRTLKYVDQFSSMSDVWEAPAQLVTPGRLNLEYEPLLYTGVGNPITAAFEARVQPGDVFAMIEYVAREPITVARIESIVSTPGLKASEVRKLTLISQFLEDAFTQRASPEESHIYIAPEIIAKEFFDWPPEVVHGWGYPSVVSPFADAYNACFRPDQARRSLRFTEVLVATCTQITDEGLQFERNRILRPSSSLDELEISWEAIESGVDRFGSPE